MKLKIVVCLLTGALAAASAFAHHGRAAYTTDIVTMERR